MGAPIRGYNRISGTPLRYHCDVRTPDIVVVLDPTLIGADDITAGLAQDGVVIVNSPRPPEEIRQKLELQGRKVYTVDATGIALAEIGRPIPNLPMIGSLLKVKGLSELESMARIVAKKFEGKFTKQVVDGNMKALRRGYDEIKGEK